MYLLKDQAMSNSHLTDPRELISFAVCKYGGAVCLEAGGEGQADGVMRGLSLM